MEQDIKLHDITMIELMSSTITRKERISIMVILKNIKKTNNMISADYYPEGKEPKGFMRIEDGKVIEHENASSFAAPHVRNELKRLARMDNPPVEKTVLWY